MDPLDKLEIIVKDRIRGAKAEFESGKGRHSPLYLDAPQHEIDTLSWVWTRINAIRQNAPSVSDETIERMYGKKQG